MIDIYVKYSPRNFKENRLNYEITRNRPFQGYREVILNYCFRHCVYTLSTIAYVSLWRRFRAYGHNSRKDYAPVNVTPRPPNRGGAGILT
jgi:hypothetical protein